MEHKYDGLTYIYQNPVIHKYSAEKSNFRKTTNHIYFQVITNFESFDFCSR